MREQCGGLAGCLERDHVADVLDDLDIGAAVGGGDLVADRKRAERVVASGDEQERKRGIDRSGIDRLGQRLVVAGIAPPDPGA
jgi:hypothetical protein